ncbi:hypothetical protein CLV30_11481 [Haloactinopolyspora alba]|uniref:Glycoprotein n=1 Tax=Haloactinopolyspora alba TaxID=648780 RepID=A0A2P8DVX2_9ACTN|nr:DUF6049 family protein [Haloactinopolyspora alba]PSL01351.1 hypothetical protein CLV30_11481 [Haloactinopolyspora alba]
MRRHARSRWLLAAAALAALVPGIAVAAPGAAVAANAAPAPAADPAAPPAGPAATIALHSATPSVLRPSDDELVLTGTVRNTGDEPVRNAQVLPRFSRVPLESRAEIGRVGTDQNLNWGARYSDGYDPVDALQPGETQPFTLRVPVELLDFAQSGVYIVGADVMGSPVDSEQRIRLDTERTVIPWLPRAGDLPTVPVGMLWPLADRPALMPDGTLLDDSLAAQVGAEDPLSTLVDAAADAPVTWAVDPDLVDTADAMTDGYGVVSPSGVIEGSRANSDAARAWLTSLQQATDGSNVLMLPYATPDLAALATTEPGLAGTVARRAVSVSEQAARTFGASAPAGWLDSGSVSTDALSALAEAGAGSVVVPGDAVRPRPDGPSATFDLGEGSLDAVVTDSGLSDAVAAAAVAPDPQAGALEVRQRWFAETAMIAMSAADSGATPDPLVVAPPLRWRPSKAAAEAVIASWTSIPWVEPTSVDTASNGTAGTDTDAVTPDPAEGTNRLPENNVEATAELHRQAGSYAGLLADTGTANQDLALAAVRAASTGWRSDPAAGRAYANSIADDLAAQLDEVSVTVPESVTLSSRTGTFPLTVTNDLDQAIVIGLDITSANVDRLRIDDVAERRIEPGARELVNVTAQAAANGKVPIDVQLTTGTGTAIGPARPTVVNATDYGTIGWLIVGGAGALFAAALVRRTTRRRTPEDAETAEGTTDGTAEDTDAAGTGPPSPTEPLRGTSR